MTETSTNLEHPWVPWLADAPLFVDSAQIGAFYDAVLRPRYRTVEMQFAVDHTEELTTKIGGNVGAKLTTWFPWLSGEIGFQADREKTTGDHTEHAVTLEPIESAGRQLVELSLHYLAKQSDRIWYADGKDWSSLPPPMKVTTSPRMMVYIDFQPLTQFLPMAAELNDGQVVTFFDRLVKRFQKDGGSLPVRYPDDPNDAEARSKYWAWFSSPEHWSANKAIQVIEGVIGAGGRPRWIDYRVPIDPLGERTIHLHVVGRGEHDTGVFAYNLVKRGWRHGLRVVGTLKSEPDVNVLAIYEK